MARANNEAIEKHLAGELDTTGHHVEVRELVIGRRIVKVLIVDGEG
jgi:hypothetical protein